MSSAILAVVVLVSAVMIAALVLVLTRPSNREGPKSENSWFGPAGGTSASQHHVFDSPSTSHADVPTSGSHDGGSASP